jgi:hypothetical protein
MGALWNQEERRDLQQNLECVGLVARPVFKTGLRP